MSREGLLEDKYMNNSQSFFHSFYHTCLTLTHTDFWFWNLFRNTAILDIASANLDPFLAICWTCCLNRSCLSKTTPRYRASGDGWMTVFAIRIAACVDLFGCLVKCIRTYLEVSNLAPCASLHLSALSNILSSSLALSSSVSPRTPNAMSSMNTRLSPLVTGMSSRSAL